MPVLRSHLHVTGLPAPCRGALEQHDQVCMPSKSCNLKPIASSPQIHAPTGVTHAVAGAFTQAAAADGVQPDVVLARSTRLELWRGR